MLNSRIQGVILIVFVAFMWVGASELTQSIMVHMFYDKPLLLTYISTCCFSTYLVLAMCSKDSSHEQLDQWRPTGRIILPFWFFANLSFNISLSITTVASNTVLCNTSSLWTLLLGVHMKVITVTPYHIAAVALQISGATLVAVGDTHDGPSAGHSFVGDILALLSAVLYASYTMLLDRYVKDEAHVSVVIGWVGVYGIVLLWPLLFIAHWVGYESLEQPTLSVVGMLLINSFLGTVVPQMLWARGVILASPLIATLGLSLTIPLSMVSDVLFQHVQYSTLYLFGCGLVLCGFVVGSLKRQEESGGEPAVHSDVVIFAEREEIA
eukprot:PhF_6_TR5130/c0_g1_i1/m.7287/K15289/SLC35F5; solute carrier family 35, member F5